MAQVLFHRAERKRSKLRLAIAGPSGAGKTYSSLLIGSGITSMDKIAVIDTESGSADLYADLGPYSTLTVCPPYSPQKYIDAIHAAEQSGFELIIIDSLSHAWSGEGGLLDQQGKATDTKYRGNSWAAWREITPQHNQLVETMLHSSCHIIATMRSKTAYEQTVDSNGRKKIEKLGLAPIQRDGIEYEFTTVFDLALNHTAMVSKDRTKLFDGQYFTPNAEVGKALRQWLDAGVPADQPASIPAEQWPTPSQPAITPAAHQAQQPQQVHQPQPAQAPAVQPAPTAPAPAVQPAPTARDQLVYIWQQLHWDAADPLDGYMAKRLAQQHREMSSVTPQDWEALLAEMDKYMAETGIMIDNPQKPVGAPCVKNEIPFN
jgi:hypothetical protein